MYFIDIETVSQTKDANAHPLYDHWRHRNLKEINQIFQDNDGHTFNVKMGEMWKQKACLTAEFGKIVCVCLGKIVNDEIQVKIFASRFENLILKKLADNIDRVNSKGEPVSIHLCAHNGFEFDFPYLFRRYLINGLPIPRVLNVNSLKKWEWPLYDTMTMWSHTAWNYKCSLDLLCQILNIPSPKGDITGADVASIYYGMFDGPDEESPPFDKETEALMKIGRYCAGDVIATARLYCKLKGIPVPTKSSIVE